jgi:hypothetical protein
MFVQFGVAAGKGLRREDLEHIRRSLALASSLPADEARALLEEVERLRADRDAADEDVRKVLGAAEALRRRLRRPAE